MSVLVHDCRRADDDRGWPFMTRDQDGKQVPCGFKSIARDEEGNRVILIHGCIRRISLDKASELVALGLAQWKKRRDKNGELVNLDGKDGELILRIEYPLHARIEIPISGELGIAIRDHIRRKDGKR